MALAMGALCFILGMAAGLNLRPGSDVTPLDPPAPKVDQPDGSVVLPRLPAPGARPTAALPEGGRAERITRITLEPLPALPEARDLAVPLEPTPPRPLCPPVQVELVLVRMPDGTRRVVAMANGARITEGEDLVLEAPPTPREFHWSLGTIRTSKGKFGGLVQYQRRNWFAQVAVVGSDVQSSLGFRF